MILTDASCRLSICATVLPPATCGPLTAPATLSLANTHVFNVTPGAAAWAARLVFGAATQVATVNWAAGTVVPAVAGTRQVLSNTVTAGCTTAGTLTLTVTAAGLTGSPRALTIPVTPYTHPSPASVAAAIRHALAADSDIGCVARNYDIGGSGTAFTLTRHYAAANDPTLAVAVSPGLGVALGATVPTAGVVGVVVERLGGSGKDAFGVAIPALPAPMTSAIMLSAPASSSLAGVTGVLFPTVNPGTMVAVSNNLGICNILAATTDFTAAGAGAVLDIVCISVADGAY